MIDRSSDPDAAVAAIREAAKPKPLPKRFYKDVTVGAAGGEFRILLDGRPVRTPGKRLLALPTHALAEAVAEEWRAQGATIDPATMPMTRIVNSGIEGVAGREADVAADIVKYAGSDLVCYRAEHPGELMARQAHHWDPVLEWAQTELGCRLAVAAGVMPVQQSEAAMRRFADALAGLDPLRLAALHVMTTLLGSALLALAHARGRLDARAAWDAAQVDEDFQAGKWGEDAEAARRRQQRQAEFMAASRVMALLTAG